MVKPWDFSNHIQDKDWLVDGKPFPMNTEGIVKKECAAMAAKTKKVSSSDKKAVANAENATMLMDYDGVSRLTNPDGWRIEFSGGMEDLIVKDSASRFY